MRKLAIEQLESRDLMAALVGPGAVGEGDTYTLTIQNPPAISFGFVNWGDGVFGTFNRVPSGSTLYHQYIDGQVVPGSTPTHLIQVGLYGATAQNLTKPITVENLPPSATVPESQTIQEGSKGAIKVIGATDPSPMDRTSLRYRADFDGNGSMDTGLLTSPTITIPTTLLRDGPRVLNSVVRVQDKDGGYTDYSHQITITNVAPQVFSSEATAYVGATFNAEMLYSDPGGDTHAATVDYGDGTVETITAPGYVPLVHAWDAEGVYDVLVTVTDDDGGQEQGTMRVTVSGQEPVTGLLIDGPTTTILTGQSGAAFYAVDVSIRFDPSVVQVNGIEIGGNWYGYWNEPEPGWLLVSAYAVTPQQIDDLVIHWLASEQSAIDLDWVSAWDQNFNELTDLVLEVL